MFACKNCGKEFNRKYHLERHQKRKNKCEEKHTINVDICIPENSQGGPENSQVNWATNKVILKSEEINKNNTKTTIQCEYCNRNFTRIDNLHVHKKKYCKNKKNEDDKVDSSHVISKLKDTIKDLENKIVINNTTNNTTHNTTNNNIHITNNIINFSDLNYDVDDSFMYKCLKNGFHGDIDYLRRVYIESIPSDARPVKCLDPSRDKCVVRKNGEWIASTGKDIYRQSLKRIVDNYLRVNNSMIDENEDINRDNTNNIDSDSTEYNYEYNDEDYIDIKEYLNHYEAANNTNEKMDEYIDNLNRITRMMEDKNVERVRKHMNILLK